MFTKEKNLLTFTVRTKRYPEGINYQFDCNTGETVRLDNQKKIPNKPIGVISELKSLIEEYKPGTIQHDFGRMLLFIYHSSECFDDIRTTSPIVEKIFAIGKSLDYDTYYGREQLQYINKNFQYLKDYPSSVIYYLPFRRYVEKQTFRQHGNGWETLTDREIYNFIRFFDNKNITEQEVQDTILNIYNKSHIGEFLKDSFQAMDIVANYLTFCKFLNHKPEHKNFMREFVEVQRTYNLMKEKFDNERIMNNYQLHSKAWDFEYNGFTVIVPTCGKDLVTEGERMHHCVGSYVKKITENQYYVCFIRKIDNIDEPYITCGIAPSGTITQYFLAYDQTIQKAVDKEFKKVFQEHLIKNW